MAKAQSAAAKKPADSPGQQRPADERHRMIAEAAYFRALARGFAGGDPLEDWLTAEQEISRTLSGQAPPEEVRAA